MSDLISNINAIFDTLYELLFKEPQYPFFTLVQMIWSLYQIRSYFFTDPTLKEKKILSIIQAGFAIFLPRYLASFFFRIRAPLSRNPEQMYSFLYILCLFYLTPHDLFMKILSNRYILFILALIQGINETRFLQMGYRNSKYSDFQIIFLILIIFSSSIPYFCYSNTSFFSFSIFILVSI